MVLLAGSGVADFGVEGAKPPATLALVWSTSDGTTRFSSEDTACDAWRSSIFISLCVGVRRILGRKRRRRYVGKSEAVVDPAML